MNYEVVNMIVPASERDEMNALLDNSGIEGCVNVFGRACWPDDAVLTYLPNGEVDMANSPAPTHYMASGWLHKDAIALLPESVVNGGA